MKNKEIIIGLIVIISMFGIMAVVTGIYGVLYLGLAFVVAAISINLFTRKSILAKTGALVINTNLIFKIFMPNKYKKAINELKDDRQNKET